MNLTLAHLGCSSLWQWWIWYWLTWVVPVCDSDESDTGSPGLFQSVTVMNLTLLTWVVPVCDSSDSDTAHLGCPSLWQWWIWHWLTWVVPVCDSSDSDTAHLGCPSLWQQWIWHCSPGLSQSVTVMNLTLAHLGCLSVCYMKWVVAECKVLLYQFQLLPYYYCVVISMIILVVINVYNVWLQIACCVAGSDCQLLFFGCMSGVISVYRTKYNPHKVGLVLVPCTFVLWQWWLVRLTLLATHNNMWCQLICHYSFSSWHWIISTVVIVHCVEKYRSMECFVVEAFKTDCQCD